MGVLYANVDGQWVPVNPPAWGMWWGTEEQYNALGSWDDRVLYVIVQNVVGAVTTVTPEDVVHVP